MNGTRRPLVVAFFAAGVGLSVAAENEDQPKKTHSIFMGTDVLVEVNEAFHRVRNVSRSSWVITLDGRPEFIRTEQRRLNLRLKKELKLANANATLANLKSERSYTSGNHPLMQAVKSQGKSSSYMTDLAIIENIRMGNAVLQHQIAAMNAGKAGESPSDEAKDALNEAMETYLMMIAAGMGVVLARGSLASESTSAPEVGSPKKTHTLFMGTEVSVEFENAFRRVREVSRSSWVIASNGRPEFIPTEGRSLNLRVDRSLKLADTTGVVANLKSDRAYTPGNDPRMKAVQSQGRASSMATDMAMLEHVKLGKRVELTREEAFQYIVIEHIGDNKGKTVPAVPAMVTVTPELKTKLGAGEGQQVYYVKVSKDGIVTEAFEDDHYSQAIHDPFFAEAVKRIWFKPALEKGKPVESKTSVDITKFFL